MALDWMLAGYDVRSRMFAAAIITKVVMISFWIRAENDYSTQNFDPHVLRRRKERTAEAVVVTHTYRYTSFGCAPVHLWYLI